jgi:hypothetical protein
MTGDEYRVKATEMMDRARKESDPQLRAQFDNLTLAYLRLSVQADRNSKTDLVYETPPRPGGDGHDLGPIAFGRIAALAE